MFQPHRLVLVICFLLASSHQLPAQAQSDQAPAAGWYAGLAKIDITPEQPMPMAGYGARGAKHAEGQTTPLWAKAMVIRDATNREGVIITLDLVGIDRSLAQQLCKQLNDQWGYTRSQVLISTSHTHSGPVVGKNLRTLHYDLLEDADRKLVDAYEQTLLNKVIQCVAQAHERLQPVELAWTSGFETFAVNRRNNKEPEVPAKRVAGTLVGPVDHSVPVLAVRHEQKLVGVLFGYACHATTLGGQRWSGDYPGHAQQYLETAYPDSVAMFWAGCGADQNPIPRRDEPLAVVYGERLGKAVQLALDGVMKPLTASLHTDYQEVDVPFAELPNQAILTEQAQSQDRYAKARAQMLLERLQQAPLDKTYPYPISVWQIGDVQWIALGGEVVVDYSIRLKRERAAATMRLPESIWVMGYAHDVMAYIPSVRVLNEGGYEGGGAMVYYGQPTIWGSAIEELIIEHALKLGTK